MKAFRPLNRALQTSPLVTTHPLSMHQSPRGPLKTKLPPLTKTEEILLERCILNPQRAETCQSGTDDEVGAHKSPYDRSNTTPEKEHLALEEEYRLEGDFLHDPLSVSPANLDVSLILDPMVGVGAGGVGRAVPHLRSVRGWTRKGRQVVIKTCPFEARRYEDVFFGRGKAMTRGVEKKG
ncbi:uncharacterized protein N7511_011107 [Penicillium nucicola]|uniref:uncharacterized protein n=1 Tax=Penicillium nucicola TaxID=1850975 RepID=UPI00254570F3|nr:uncharacterized protein N7511_011107 [Penicillium nucicola]KAJ5742706.1 hypothetical protein N7511_011107 [Penicillium nucicola]